VHGGIAVGHLIDGKWIGEPDTERRNPARPNEVVAQMPVGGRDEAEAAIDAALRALQTWREAPAPLRGAILLRAADLLLRQCEDVSRALVAEEGKTLVEAAAEVNRAVDILRFYGSLGWQLGGETLPASIPNTHLYTTKEPLGVVAVITPWNFPIGIPAMKMAPALVAGNTVVLKPAQLTPLSANHLAKCLLEAGLPEGVLNVVHGPGSVLGDALVRDNRVSAISFTGSTEVGLRVNELGSARLARVQVEMGGKNALVVLDDSEPTSAARLAAQGGFGVTGQACMATSRVIVTRSAHDKFIESLAEESRTWIPGDGMNQGVKMGPVVSEAQLATDLSYLAIARSEGAALLSGGEASELFLTPAVVGSVRNSMRIAQEEIFGPVICVIEAEDLDHAIAITNESKYGLVAGIVTNDLNAAMRFASEADVGVVKVNRPTTGLEVSAPFGGVRLSSTATFRELGSSAVDFYTRIKSVYLGT
jgi:alpha-ketoglutaric semialdehyde dehydrogenase